MRARKPYHNTNAGLLAFVTVCAVLNLVWAVLRPKGASAAALGGMLEFATVLATVLSSVAMASAERTRARNVERLRAGDTWVRWPVDSDLWEHFMRDGSARGLGSPRRHNLLGALVVAPFAMLAGAIDGVALVLTMGTGYLPPRESSASYTLHLWVLPWADRRPRRSPRASRQGEILIGPPGVLTPAGYRSLGGDMSRPVKVSVYPPRGDSPGVLRIGRFGNVRVPIPPGREIEAAELVWRLETGAGDALPPGRAAPAGALPAPRTAGRRSPPGADARVPAMRLGKPAPSGAARRGGPAQRIAPVRRAKR
jgi:hypothetical protein